MSEVIVIAMTREELKQMIKEAVEECMRPAPHTESDIADNEIIDNETLEQRMNVSRYTVAAWRKKGKLRFMKIGGCYRYNWKHVLEDLERGK